MDLLNNLRQRFNDFFTRPADVRTLGLFRILLSLFLLVQAFLWLPDWANFLGREGWVQWELTRALNQFWHLHMEVLFTWVEPYGLTDVQFIYLFFWVYVGAGLGLLLGWYTRIWAVIAYLCHYVIMSTLPTFMYGVDIFLHISLFYMVLMPVGKVWSLDARQGRANPEPTWSSTLSIRVLQIHLCLVYFSAGYEKMAYSNWWEGNVLYRSMVQPDFRQFDLRWLAYVPVIPMVLSWLTMILETFYFIGMFVPRLRVYWLAGMIGLHLGIGLFLGLYLFGLIMILLSVSAFGVSIYKDLRHWRKEHRFMDKSFSFSMLSQKKRSLG